MWQSLDKQCYSYSKYLDRQDWENIADSDQNAAADQGLYFLPHI